MLRLLGSGKSAPSGRSPESSRGESPALPRRAEGRPHASCPRCTGLGQETWAGQTTTRGDEEKKSETGRLAPMKSKPGTWLSAAATVLKVAALMGRMSFGLALPWHHCHALVWRVKVTTARDVDGFAIEGFCASPVFYVFVCGPAIVTLAYRSPERIAGGQDASVRSLPSWSASRVCWRTPSCALRIAAKKPRGDRLLTLATFAI